MSLTGAVERWEAERGSTYVLGLTRILFGLLLLWEAVEASRSLEHHGYFGDRFHVPFPPGALVPPIGVYAAVLCARVLLALLVLLGLQPRPALIGSAALGLYCLLLDRLQYHHNLYSLLCFSFLLGFTPCGDSFALRAPTARTGPSTGPLWAVRLAQLQLSVIYLASSGSKLLDPDWRDGTVLGQRVAHALAAKGRELPASLVHVLSWHGTPAVLTVGTIATELFLAFGLWVASTRPLALWWGCVFHLTIEATSNVQIFSWLMLATYTLFVTADFRARQLLFDASSTAATDFAKILAKLDWFARLEIRPAAPGEIGPWALVIVDRDGARSSGLAAFCLATRCLPLLFPLWAPVAVLTKAAYWLGGLGGRKASSER